MGAPSILAVRQFSETTATSVEQVVNTGGQNRTEWVLDPSLLPAYPSLHLWGVYSSSVPYTIRLRVNTDPSTAGAASGTVILELVLPTATFPTAFTADLSALSLSGLNLLKLCHVGNGARLAYASLAIVSNPPIAPPPTLARTDVVETGVDLDCIADTGKSFTLAKSVRNIGNALARRLTTPRGGLFYDGNYGIDVRSYLNAGMTSGQISQVQADIAAEVSKDPRVENPIVTVTTDLPAASMSITIACEIADAPFEFQVAVSALTVELITAEALA